MLEFTVRSPLLGDAAMKIRSKEIEVALISEGTVHVLHDIVGLIGYIL